jgi:large subunit ribosomal protein L3
MGHGSKFHRAVGSLSSATTPGKVKKGKKMAGHMGSVKVTIQNLEVVRADADKNLLLIKGAVPGPKNAVLVIKNSVKAN